MILEDLEYIFKPQIEEGTTKLYFMLIDGADLKEVYRHPASDTVSYTHLTLPTNREV